MIFVFKWQENNSLWAVGSCMWEEQQAVDGAWYLFVGVLACVLFDSGRVLMLFINVVCRESSWMRERCGEREREMRGECDILHWMIQCSFYSWIWFFSGINAQNNNTYHTKFLLSLWVLVRFLLVVGNSGRSPHSCLCCHNIGAYTELILMHPFHPPHLLPTPQWFTRTVGLLHHHLLLCLL